MTQVQIQTKEVMVSFRQTQFQEWREHPITKQLFAYFADKRNELMELWASGGLAAPTVEECALRNAAAQGAASVLYDVLSLDSDSFSEVNR